MTLPREVARKGRLGGGGHHQQGAVASLDQVDDRPRRMVVVGDGVAVVRPAVVRSSPPELEDVDVVGKMGRRHGEQFDGDFAELGEPTGDGQGTVTVCLEVEGDDDRRETGRIGCAAGFQFVVDRSHFVAGVERKRWNRPSMTSTVIAPAAMKAMIAAIPAMRPIVDQANVDSSRPRSVSPRNSESRWPVSWSTVPCSSAIVASSSPASWAAASASRASLCGPPSSA